MHSVDILIRPIITEKSTQLHDSGRYIFQVAPKATKTQVKDAVEQAFDVHVAAVNILKLPGKRKRYGPRLSKARSIKKAVVTLRAGDRIQIFEGL
jgi:large subunit ribosomal protein L23